MLRPSILQELAAAAPAFAAFEQQLEQKQQYSNTVLGLGPSRTLLSSRATSDVVQIAYSAVKVSHVEVEKGKCSQSDQTGNYSSFHLEI